MKKLAIVFAIGAAALTGGSAAYAADNTVKATTPTGVAVAVTTMPGTDTLACLTT